MFFIKYHFSLQNTTEFYRSKIRFTFMIMIWSIFNGLFDIKVNDSEKYRNLKAIPSLFLLI